MGAKCRSTSLQDEITPLLVRLPSMIPRTLSNDKPFNVNGG